MLILNFKTYPESTASEANTLATIISEAVNDNPSAAEKIFAAPALTDLANIRTLLPNLKLISQHVDFQAAGSSTGRIPATMLSKLGIEYSLLNHSEHRVWNEEINNQLGQLQNQGIKLVVCCENIQEAEKLAVAKPFAIALEPKELIGSGKSVSTYRAQEVIDFLKLLTGTGIKGFIGAGISNAEDIKAGNELGAEGYLLASAFVKAPDKVSLLNDFISVL